MRDVARLHAFLAPKNPDAAKRAVRAIRQRVKVLQRFPEIGRPVEDMPGDFREWIIRFGSSGYVVLYRPDNDAIVLLAIRHGREAGYL